ncbi:MAG: RluA family pseudouridine synthase [Candidatus Delongbacteria bacterium]|jgi:RluA family pseudouridine synthase|nr:RluA family pseudouridine synthase [Candidatus Delongbacteria bacterium]
MASVPKTFKQPPSRYQPRGLNILYEDQDIIVVDKTNGLLTISTDRIKEKTAHFLLNDYVKKGNPKSKIRIFIVHRLDRDTSGVLVFAKTEEGKRYLQDNWKAFNKTYFAVVHGNFKEKEGMITSYLVENAAHRMYSTKNTEKGKLSTTGYKVIKESSNYSLLEINLLTGRKNQIRVHLAEKGHPVVGDKMYGDKGKGVKRLALHAASLTILHPFSKEEMTFKTELPAFMKNILKN